MPIGDGQHAIARGLQADFFFAAYIAAHKGKHRIALRLGDEQIRKLHYIRLIKIPRTAGAARHQLAAKGIQQAFIHNQPRRHHHKVTGKTGVVHAFGQGRAFVQQLPNQQGLQHPSLARARCHLEAVFGVGVFAC